MTAHTLELTRLDGLRDGGTQIITVQDNLTTKYKYFIHGSRGNHDGSVVDIVTKETFDGPQVASEELQELIGAVISYDPHVSYRDQIFNSYAYVWKLLQSLLRAADALNAGQIL
jgi:hypothetical protein